MGQTQTSFQKEGGCCQLAAFPALFLSCAVISLGPWPGKEHIGGFPQGQGLKQTARPMGIQTGSYSLCK